jgi:hypothetical protein
LEKEENARLCEDFPVVSNSAVFLRKFLVRKKKMKNLITICAAIVLFGTGYARAGTWTPLDYPGAYQTVARGISGDSIVGQAWDSSGYYGFLYNGGNWTKLSIIPSCIDGSNIVGYSEPDYQIELYNLTTGSLTPLILHHQVMRIAGISGDNFVGDYDSGGVGRSFLSNSNGSSWTTLDYPGAPVYETYAQGISGSSVVGYYGDSSGNHHGFLYNGTSWTTFDYPGASETIAQGINENSIVGQYQDSSGSHGFLYNGSSWTTLSYPGAMNTYAYGISGNNIVGIYNDGSGSPSHGFIYEIPEPATLLLLGFGAVIVRRKRKVLSP